MSNITRHHLLQAISQWDVDGLRSLLEKAKHQHIPLSDHIYPELPQIVHSLYNHIGAAPMADRQWQVLSDAAYEILELLKPYYEFGEDEKLLQNHFLFHPLMHGDVRMLEYLWALEPLKYREHAQPLAKLFRAAIEDYCYMCLPEWEGLPVSKNSHPDLGFKVYDLELETEKLLEILYAQAERCHVAIPEHLEFLLKHDCPLDGSKLTLQPNLPKLELNVCHFFSAGFPRCWEIKDQRISHIYQDCGELVKSCIRSGSYWSLTCECDFPECARVYDPVLSMRFGNIARWRVTPSEDDENADIYYRAVPVMEYLRDMDCCLEIIERGIQEDAPKYQSDELDHPVVDFTASPNSLEKVKQLRNFIQLELSGSEIPDFEQKPAPITVIINA